MLPRSPVRVAEPTAAAVTLPPGVSELSCLQCSLRVPTEGISGSFVVAAYGGLPGNQPRLYGNFLAIWEGTVIPWTAQPLGRVAISSDATAGATVIRGLAIGRDSYTVAYGLGESVTDICASVTFGADGRTTGTRSVELGINLVESGSIAAHYRTLPGYRPAKAGNWIGLWRGEASPYDAPDPLARVAVAEDVNEDDVAIDGVALIAGRSYTLVHFLGPEPTTAAALVTFEVDGG